MDLNSKFLRKLILILGFPIIPALLAAFINKNAPVWSPDRLLEGETNIEIIASWQTEPLWVDARSGADFASDHIPRAALLNEDDWDSLLPAFLEAWKPGLKTVVYCSSFQCNASSAVAARLREELGLEEVYVLKGGWEAWLTSNR